MSEQEAARPDTTTGRRLALVIGVNEPGTATNFSQPPLLHAVDDAQLVAQVLRDSCGFDLFCPPLVGEQATSERVKHTILAMMRQCSDDDFLLLYFSGHGLPMTVSGEQLDIYLVTHDFSERDVEDDEALGFSMRWLQSKLCIPARAEKVLLILDCCFAGNIGMTASNPYLDDLKTRIYKFFGQPMGGDEGRIGGLRLALTATGHNQTASERDGNGLMTRHLVEALQGNVEEVIELEDNGAVSLQRVQRYLEKVLPATQNPSVEGGYAGKTCILAHYPERAATLRRQRQHVTVNERPTTHILRARKTTFQPRPGEFEQLERLLVPATTGETTPSLVGVIGMGGIGKTELAIELAHRSQKRFSAGVFWMPATGTTLLEWQRQFAELAAKADYLPAGDDVAHPENEAKRARHLCRYIAKHSDALLILDNVDNVELVLSALPTLAGNEARCSILYTSRITVIPYSVKKHVVERLPEAGALHLLLTYKPALLPLALPASTTDAEAQAARAICRYVDYLPLALTLLRDLLQDDEMTPTHLAEQLTVHGAFETTREDDETEARLFSTFNLSWRKITDVGAQHLFKLAAYFPEATTIPLWLLGLAAGLGETGKTKFEPLGRARRHLQKWSMIEELANEQIRLHPLIREFGRRLVENEEQGNTLLHTAEQRIVEECTDITRLEQRARAVGYWRCLEQVRQASTYAQALKGDTIVQLERIEQWLARDSSLLGTGEVWPEKIPGLFSQLLYNHMVEVGYPTPTPRTPHRWIRQTEQVGIEDNTLLREFKHPDIVPCVAYSPTGYTVATGCEDGIARLWDIASGKTLLELHGHTAGITCLAFSPDGTKIATGSRDASTRIWNIANGQERHVLKSSQAVHSVSFSSDCKNIVTTAEDGIGQVWDVATGEEFATLSKQDTALTYAIFTLDNEKVVSCSSNTIFLWDTHTEEIIKVLAEKNTGIEVHKVFLRNKNLFAVSSEQTYNYNEGGFSRLEMRITLWNIESKEVLVAIVEPESDGIPRSNIIDIAISSDCTKFIIALAGEKYLYMWDTNNDTFTTCLARHAGVVTSISISPHDNAIFTGSRDSTARIWSIVSTQKAAMTDTPSYKDTRAISFSHDGTKLARAAITGRVNIWDIEARKYTASIERASIINTSISFSSDNMSIVVGSGNGLKMVDVYSGNILLQLDRETLADTVLPSRFLDSMICLSPDGTIVVSSTYKNTIQLRDTLQGNLIAQLQGHRGKIHLLAFSPDSTHLVSGSMDGTARIWNVQDYTTTAVLEGHVGQVTSLCISPDNSLVATASLDGVVHIWSMHNGKELSLLKGGKVEPVSMAFSPDGGLLLVNDRHAYTSLWKLDQQSNGQLVGTYKTANEIKAIHWQDSRHVLLAGVDGSEYEPQIYHLALEGEW